MTFRPAVVIDGTLPGQAALVDGRETFAVAAVDADGNGLVLFLPPAARPLVAGLVLAAHPTAEVLAVGGLEARVWLATDAAGGVRRLPVHRVAVPNAADHTPYERHLAERPAPAAIGPLPPSPEELP